jgi:chlorite dismutase
MHNPYVPETLEGWSVLHLMYRVRWDRLRAMNAEERRRLADEAVAALAVPDAGATAFVQMLGHKADLMFICFRRDFEGSRAQRSRAPGCTNIEATTSCVSIVDSACEMTAKLHEQLSQTQGREPGLRARVRREMEPAAARDNRLFLELPQWRHAASTR